jgi:hypothetical protein
MMYEVVLTRLLSATCWYYLAFVAISMAMFGMTAGALAVQLCPDLFERSLTPHRVAQSSSYLALSLPPGAAADTGGAGRHFPVR